MREILPQVEQWLSENKQVATATVVSVWGSAPRRPGSRMAVSSDLEVTGSVSGGCVEGAVIEEAQTVMETGEPKLVTFGVSDETAWDVGLSCGGKISVFVEPVGESEVETELRNAIHDDRLTALATVVHGSGTGRRLLLSPSGETWGDLGSEAHDRAARDRVEEVFRSFQPTRFEIETGEERSDVFLEPHPPRPKLILIGAVHTAIPLVAFARELGFATYVVDPRRVFATEERFAHADRLIHAWPQEVLPEIGLHEATYLATLSHDPKIDLPALELALKSPCRYIGALGSTRTHGKRVKALEEKGFSQDEIDRIHAPIGLDLGGRRPEEIAVAVIAEIVSAAHGR